LVAGRTPRSRRWSGSPRSTATAARGVVATRRGRYAAWSARRLGWAGGWAGRALHGDVTGHALHPRHPDVLRAPSGGRQSETGGAGGVQAHAAHPPHRHAQTPDPLAGAGRLSLPGTDIRRHSCSFVLWGRVGGGIHVCAEIVSAGGEMGEEGKRPARGATSSRRWWTLTSKALWTPKPQVAGSIPVPTAPRQTRIHAGYGLCLRCPHSFM
jgi:hypothetical protein